MGEENKKIQANIKEMQEERGREIGKRCKKRGREIGKRCKKRGKEIGKRCKKREKEIGKRCKKRGKEIGKRGKREGRKEKREKETERLIKAIGTDLGGVTRNMSRETEQFFARGIKKNGLRIGPYQFDDIKTNEKYQHPERGEVEIDIYLPNSTVSGIGEVKNVLRAKDVRNHRDKRIPKFIDIYPEYRNKKIIGIVAR